MNKMNAFRGTDAASLAFKEELVKLAPGYYLGDLHRHIYMTGQDLVRDACTAYQEALAEEEEVVEDAKPAHPSKPLMKSFLDLGLTKNVIHGNRSSFESACQNWLSSAKMYHPAFGYFKFEYLMFGQIDYKSCFRVDDTLNHAGTSEIKKYPAPSHSWLHALPDTFAGDDSDTEPLRSTYNQFMESEADGDIYNSKDFKGGETTGHAGDSHQPCLAAPRSSKNSSVFESTSYIPPHKRSDTDSSHSRSQSDSVVLQSKTPPGRGRVSHGSQSEDGSQWQADPSMNRRTLTGGYYKPHFSLYVPAYVHSGSIHPMTESSHSRSLSTQSNYKETGQGTKAIKDLADNLNCSLFVSHLPEDIKYKEIFAVITTGSVVSVHINEPIPGRPFSAAKITFKYPEGAARFMALVNSPVGIQIRDHHVAAVYNGYGMVKHAQEHQSRVIHIHGPYKLMAEGYWRKYFGKVTRYQLDHVGYLPFDPNNKVTRFMEFRFARIEAQAQSILITIIHDPQFEGKVICKYGPDPCGKAWETLPHK
ncbi:uncharacterized protein EAE97_010401 [Botrytis byssoidea]|uniref:RRM domain-containing protein n=1 Tax=Botrytis byssoidea TaxID=139641 RepID=A0A9P5LVE5_9HELO|nr:uncharacterized protein EAE97_010401 [Botrytis byssoidea]KAF7926101.1 hypothetical protein EAE97_010401 [Botrytis byssoidea]